MDTRDTTTVTSQGQEMTPSTNPTAAQSMPVSIPQSNVETPASAPAQQVASTPPQQTQPAPAPQPQTYPSPTGAQMASGANMFYTTTSTPNLPALHAPAPQHQPVQTQQSQQPPPPPQPHQHQHHQLQVLQQPRIDAEDIQLSEQLSREAAAAAAVSNANAAPAGAHPEEPLQGVQGLHALQSNMAGALRGDGRRVVRNPTINTSSFPPSQQVGMEPHADLSYGENSARKKRSKVSRACDECRRKKVRCDASTEAGIEACTSCRRTGATCEFSRVPMKRGPSKGYIKELAERINSLESQIHPGAHGTNSMSPHPPQAHPGQEMQYGAPLSAESPHGYQGFAPGIDNAMLGQDGAGGRKRTYSMSEGIAGGFMASPGPNANFSQQQTQGMQNVNMALRTPSAVAGWPVQGAGANGNKEGVMTQPQAPQTQSEQRDLYATSYPNATEAAKPTPPFWAQDGFTAAIPELGHQAPPSGVGEGQDATAPATPIIIDEAALHGYYAHVHGLLPILPHSLHRTRTLVADCPRSVQEIFVQSLYAATSANASRISEQQEGKQAQDDANSIVSSFEKAQDRLYTFMRTGHPSSRSRSSNLVLLMSLLLMALEADARGPENLRGQNGLPKAALLEGAHTIAWWLAKELNVNRTYIPAGLTNEQAASGSGVEANNAVGSIEDPDSDHALARRVWIVTAIMSRWHALATAGPDVFEAVEVATLEDKKCLTAGVLQLARYSTLISEIYDLVFDASANGVASSRALKRMISGQIARIGDIEAGLSTAAGLENSASEMDRYVADTLSPQMYWFLTMLLRRHLHSDNPAEILYPAEVMVDLLHKHFLASNTLAEETDPLQQPQISIKQSPFDVHFLSLTALTLLELTENPTLQSDAWKALHKLRPILDTRERLATEASKLEFSAASFFRTVGWDASLRSLIDIRAAADHNSIANVNVDNVGENGINLGLDFENGGDHENEMSLQRLADLAVGAGAKAEEKQGERNTGGATEEQMGQAQGGGQQSEGRVILVDHSRLTRKGYLNVVAGL